MSSRTHKFWTSNNGRQSRQSWKGLGRLGVAMFATVLALVAAEVSLRGLGRYDDLANAALSPSASTLWKPTPRATQHRKHPDVSFDVSVIYDSSGVRNHSGVDTSDKSGIVGVFGDIFTENIRVPDSFTFTSILDELASDEYNFVNFGVDGYGLDQSYLRYKAFKNVEIIHVVYLMYYNDFRNIYENDLAFLEAQKVRFKDQNQSRILRRVVGQLRLTYLVLEAYYKGRAIIETAFAGTGDGGEQQLRTNPFDGRHLKRERDDRHRTEYAHSIYSDIVSEQPTDRTVRYAELFRAILTNWQKELAAAGREFTILVVPEEKSVRLAKALKLDASHEVVFLSDGVQWLNDLKFKNDGHWNEAGNIKAAFILARLPAFAPYLKTDLDLKAAEQRFIAEARRFYDEHPPH